MTLPAAASPPVLAMNVESGRVSSCFSKLPNANSLFWMIGPPAHPPVLLVLKSPGLNASPLASVPTNDSLRNR